MNMLSLQYDSATDVLRPADGIEFTDTGHLNTLLKTVCTDLKVFLKNSFLLLICVFYHISYHKIVMFIAFFNYMFCVF